MTDQELAEALKAAHKEWDDQAATVDDDEGHGGSPGEGLVERIGELDTEIARRKAAKRKAKRS